MSVVKKKSTAKNKPAQQGFTLIEVLVALLIMSVGMLGVAGMQTRGLQSGGLATHRLQVVMKVQEIAERIRINSAAVDSYVTTATAYGTNNKCFNATVCTEAQMVAYDIYLWKQDLLSILPNDSGTTAVIAVDNDTPATTLATITITISWKSMAGQQTYSTSFQVDSTNTVLNG